MKVGVRVLPRKEVLDSQGRAVAKTLEHHGITLNSCRVGRFVELEFDTNSMEEAQKKAKEVAEFVLYNPLVETYEIEALNE